MDGNLRDTYDRLETHVGYARQASDRGIDDAARSLCEASVGILEEFITNLPEKGGHVSYGKARTQVPEELVGRLVRTYGSLEAAEEWYNRPNCVLHGETPAELVARQGMGWLLDATCNWGLRAMEVVPE